jgi:aspartate aminotransferase-like enzyme
MTPFTPAVVAILQAEARMSEIKGMGIDQWTLRCKQRAAAFREVLATAGYTPFPERCSNAMTAVRLPEGVLTSQLVTHLRERYDWWFAANGTNREDYLRVSHMGNLPTNVMCEVANGIAQGIRLFQEGGRQ